VPAGATFQVTMMMIMMLMTETIIKTTMKWWKTEQDIEDQWQQQQL